MPSSAARRASSRCSAGVAYTNDLKARPHAGDAAEFIALFDWEPGDGVEVAEDDELALWLGLEVDLSRRREEAEIAAATMVRTMKIRTCSQSQPSSR